jgi:hypothetical protein
VAATVERKTWALWVAALICVASPCGLEPLVADGRAKTSAL